MLVVQCTRNDKLCIKNNFSTNTIKQQKIIIKQKAIHPSNCENNPVDYSYPMDICRWNKLNYFWIIGKRQNNRDPGIPTVEHINFVQAPNLKLLQD